MRIPKIYGFNKSSESGPDSFGISIFLNGCNMKCPYCMNSRVCEAVPDLEIVPLGTIKEYVMDNEIDWITISGGEPTLANLESLLELIEVMQSWGCSINLCTNGTYPEKLSKLIKAVEYVTMDFKIADAALYSRWTKNGDSLALEKVTLSKSMLLAEKQERDAFDYEIRTTLIPEYVNKKMVSEINSIIVPNERWILQQFRQTPNVEDKTLTSYSEDEIKDLVKEISDKVEIRYI